MGMQILCKERYCLVEKGLQFYTRWRNFVAYRRGRIVAFQDLIFESVRILGRNKTFSEENRIKRCAMKQSAAEAGDISYANEKDGVREGGGGGREGKSNEAEKVEQKLKLWPQSRQK